MKSKTNGCKSIIFTATLLFFLLGIFGSLSAQSHEPGGPPLPCGPDSVYQTSIPFQISAPSFSTPNIHEITLGNWECPIVVPEDCICNCIIAIYFGNPDGPGNGEPIDLGSIQQVTLGESIEVNPLNPSEIDWFDGDNVLLLSTLGLSNTGLQFHFLDDLPPDVVVTNVIGLCVSDNLNGQGHHPPPIVLRSRIWKFLGLRGKPARR